MENKQHRAGEREQGDHGAVLVTRVNPMKGLLALFFLGMQFMSAGGTQDI